VRVTSSRWARVWFALWVGMILLVVVPWFTYQNHSHWAGVTWIPFLSPPFKPRDIVLNTLFYMPFGFFLLRGYQRRTRFDAAIAGLVLSALTELTQVYGHYRFPTTTDIVCNTLGAYLGAMWAQRRDG
jgi:glycopeptide antibiotics resistance protein